MQAGFDPKLAHLGTPVSVPLPSARGLAVKNSLANEIFLNSMQYPDMSVNEKKIVFREQAPMLQGMQLTHVPTGGFPNRQPSIIIGAGPDGIEYNTRMPTLFTQPSVPDKRMLVMPDRPLTGENGGETVFREPDNKLRSAHGAMSVKRAAQEAASGLRRQVRSKTQLFNEAFTPEENMAAFGTPFAPDLEEEPEQEERAPPVLAVPRPPPRATPTPVQQVPTPTPRPPAPFQLTAAAPRGGRPTTSLAETGGRGPLLLPSLTPAPAPSSASPATPADLVCPSITSTTSTPSFWHNFGAAQRGFWGNLGKVMGGKMSLSEFNTIARQQQQWTYVLLLFLFILLLVFFVVMIALAARR